MMSSQRLNQEQILKWLQVFGGSGRIVEDSLDHVLNELRAIGTDKLFPFLMSLINDSNNDINVRCQSSRALLNIDKTKGIELLLPFFKDSDSTFRCDICGLMHEFGDERVIEALIDRLKNDPDPKIRGTAAYALGGIGMQSSITALQETMANDFEFDNLGYSPSFCAEMAINEIQKKTG